MNPFNAPDFPLTTSQVVDSLVTEVRTALLQQRRVQLRLRLASLPADPTTLPEITGQLAGLVLLSCALLPASDFREVQCEAMSALHEIRFLIGRTSATSHHPEV